jgi:hypothetical protein
MTQSIRRINLEIHRPSETAIETTRVDTDSPQQLTPGLAAELHKQIEKLIGVDFNVVMNDRGAILDVSIPEDSLAVIRHAPASMKLRELLTADGLKSILGQSAIVFPEKDNASQSPSTMEVVNAIGKVAMESRIKYQGREKRNGTESHAFKIESTARVIEAAAADDAPRMDSYTGTGKAWFWPDEVLVYESQFENRIKMSRQYRDQRIGSTVTTEIKMQVVKK